MQLVLVNKSVVGQVRPYSQSYDFIVEREDIHRSLMAYRQANVSNEENLERKKVVTEIMVDDPRSRLLITIWQWSHNGTVEISVTPCYPEESVFKSLVQKFQEDVKISVYFKTYIRDPQNRNIMNDIDLASVEGMTINQAFMCRGTTANISRSLESFQNCRVRLVADIVIADTDTNVIAIPKGIPYAQKILEKESCSDVVIVAANEAEIKAHKSFLSVCSPAFEAMFATNMKESQTGRVVMSDFSEEGVRAFLRYVYHDDLKDPQDNIQVAFELLCVSHRYFVSSLEAEMRKLLLDRKNEDIDVELALKMYMLTKNIDSAVDLKKKALRILKTKWGELELLQEYQDMFDKSSYSKKSLLELCRDLATSPSS